MAGQISVQARHRVLSVGATQQSLAADGAIACFSSNFVPFSLDADRAPQLKAVVRLLPVLEEMRLYPSYEACAQANGFLFGLVVGFIFSADLRLFSKPPKQSKPQNLQVQQRAMVRR